MKLTVKQIFFVLSLFFCFCLAFAIRYPFHFQSSLMDIFPKNEDSYLSNAVMDKYSAFLNVIIEADSVNEAEQTAQMLSKTFKEKDFHLQKVPANVMSEISAYFSAYQNSFLSDAVRKDLLLDKTADVRQRSFNKIATSWSPLLLPIKQDVFCLIDDYVKNMKKAPLKWTVHNGFLWQKNNEKDYVLLQIQLSTENTKQMIKQISKVKEIVANYSSQAKIYLSGTPLHTAEMFEKSRFEMMLFSVLTFSFLLILTWLLFHKINVLFWVAINLLIAFFCGLVALLLFCSEIHFLAFAFGASLIGICVDYSFHRLSIANKDQAQSTRKNLLYSFLTTVLCFIPLLFSNLPLLRQMAIFTVFGLIGTYIWVNLIYVKNNKIKAMTCHVPALLKNVLFIFCGMSVLGMCFLKIENSPKNLYEAPDNLKNAEAMFYQLNGKERNQLLIIQADTLQEVLEKEEKLKEKYSFFSLSSLLPSVSRQKENQALIKKLYKEEAQTIGDMLKMEEPALYKEKPIARYDTLNASYRELLSQFIIQEKGRVLTVTPLSENIYLDRPDIKVLSVGTFLSEQLDKYAKESYLLLGISFVLLLIMLFFMYGKKMFVYGFSPLLGTATTIGFFCILGQSITFFHILSLFLVVGLGLDYAIFHFDESQSHFKTVLFSFLSSLFGFGLLSYVSFKPIAIMGQTISVGLAVTYLTSLVFIKKKKSLTTKEEQVWFEQKEQSAGKFRLLFLWYVYKLLGLRVLKMFLYPIVFFIYLFAKPARLASKSYQQVLFDYCKKHKIKRPKISTYKHILSYAFSLAEKMSVICDDKLRLSLSIEQDKNWKSFSENIAKKKGMFLLCSHVGNIEALASFSKQFLDYPVRKLTALMQMSQSGVFRQFIEKRNKNASFNLFPAENLDFDGIMQLYENLLSGELIMMASDRVSAENPEATINSVLLDRNCKLPYGTFKFAKKLKHPVFAIALLRIKKNEYRLFLKQLDTSLSENKLALQYTQFLESLILQFPEQWYNFYRFFE